MNSANWSCTLTLVAYLSLAVPSHFVTAEQPTKKARVPPQLKKVPKTKGQQVAPAGGASGEVSEPQTPEERRKAADALIKEYDQEFQRRYKSLENKCKQLRSRLDKLTYGSKQHAKLNDQVNAAEAELAALPGAAEQRKRKAVHKVLADDSPYKLIDGNLVTDAEIAQAETDKKEKAAALEAAKKLRGNPRQVADAYIDAMVRDGSLRKASFVQERNDLVTGCFDINQVADWPQRMRTVHYEVKYVSKGGMILERQGYVILFRSEDGLWFISTDTRLDPNGIHF